MRKCAQSHLSSGCPILGSVFLRESRWTIVNETENTKLRELARLTNKFEAFFKLFRMSSEEERLR